MEPLAFARLVKAKHRMKENAINMGRDLGKHAVINNRNSFVESNNGTQLVAMYHKALELISTVPELTSPVALTTS